MTTELESLDVELKAMTTEREGLFEKIAPAQARIIELYHEMEKLRDRRGQLQVDEMKKGEPDFKALIPVVGIAGERKGLNSTATYNYFTNELAKLGLHYSGSWGDTGEVNLEVMLTQDNAESIAQTVAAVRKFLPMLTPHVRDIRYDKDLGELAKEEGGGAVWFGIFEHSLSSGGSFRLDVTPDESHIQVGVTSYSRFRVLKTCKTLEEAITYIAKHHYYRSASEYAEGRDD